MNEFEKSQSAKILAVYGVNADDLEKSKGFGLGQLDKSGRHVKTADGWKSVKTHAHLINDNIQAPVNNTPGAPISAPVTAPEVGVTPIIPVKSLVEIRNEKNRKLSQIEEKLDDHNSGLDVLEDDEVIFLREQRKILQTVIQGLDKKIKTQKDDDIPEAPADEQPVEDTDAEPNIAA